MDILQFIKDNLTIVNNDYTYKITPELNFNFDAEKDNIVLRVQQGNRYLKGVVIPIAILITTKDPMNALEVWNGFVLNVSDRTFVEGVDSYYFMLMTPTISQVFDEISNNYYSVIQVMGTIVETNSIDDITKFEINDQELEIIEMTYVYSNMIEQAQREDYLVSADSLGAVLSGSITTYIGNNAFFTSLMNMRKNTVSNNTSFDIKITWLSGAIETFKAKLSTHGFVKRRGELSSVKIDFTHYKEVV